MSKEISFASTEEDSALIDKIVYRAVHTLGLKFDGLELCMDITAIHVNTLPLRLQEWLDSDNFNFVHDIAGIRRHIDRRDASLTGCFLPRFSKHEVTL